MKNESTMRWFIKRKPTRKSYIRNGFPYLEKFSNAGEFWVRSRIDAFAFRSLAMARNALREIRKCDKHVRIVRVAK